jgi:hypothetical protein
VVLLRKTSRSFGLYASPPGRADRRLEPTDPAKRRFPTLLGFSPTGESGDRRLGKSGTIPMRPGRRRGRFAGRRTSFLSRPSTTTGFSLKSSVGKVEAVEVQDMGAVSGWSASGSSHHGAEQRRKEEVSGPEHRPRPRSHPRRADLHRTFGSSQAPAGNDGILQPDDFSFNPPLRPGPGLVQQGVVLERRQCGCLRGLP